MTEYCISRLAKIIPSLTGDANCVSHSLSLSSRLLRTLHAKPASFKLSAGPREDVRTLDRNRERTDALEAELSRRSACLLIYGEPGGTYHQGW
jgi:hypothetical protein